MSVIHLIPKKLALQEHNNGYRVRLYLGNRRYETSSINATDLDAATKEAFKWYESRLTSTTKPKVTKTSVNFNTLVERFIAVQKTREISKEITHHQTKRLNDCIITLRRWWEENGKVPFGKFSELYDNTYLDWRIADYANGDRKRWGNRKVITNKSLVAELTSHKQFIAWCIKQGYPFKHIELKIKVDKKQGRAEFPIDKYRPLLRHLKKVAESCDNNLNRHKRYTYLYLYCLVQILAHTGLRPEEARNVKFRDVRTEEKYCLIQVKGKKHDGSCVAALKIAYYFNRLKHIVKSNPYNKNNKEGINIEDQYCFQTCYGDRSKSLYYNQWRRVRLHLGIFNVNDEDDVISLYSFRHMKISNELRRGIPVYDVALNNRTSVAQIENTYSHVIAASRHKSLVGDIKSHEYGENKAKLHINDWAAKLIKGNSSR